MEVASLLLPDSQNPGSCSKRVSSAMGCVPTYRKWWFGDCRTNQHASRSGSKLAKNRQSLDHTCRGVEARVELLDIWSGDLTMTGWGQGYKYMYDAVWSMRTLSKGWKYHRLIEYKNLFTFPFFVLFTQKDRRITELPVRITGLARAPLSNTTNRVFTVSYCHSAYETRTRTVFIRRPSLYVTNRFIFRRV